MVLQLQETARRLVRHAQVYFPGGSDAKYSVQRVYRRLLRKQFESDFQALAYVGLRAGVFIDVGANRGQTIDALRIFDKERTIVSFEPNPWLLQRLKKRYRNDSKLQVVGVGLGSSKGAMTLHVPFYSRYMYDGLASLDRAEAEQWLARHMAFFNPKKLNIREESVDVEVLDDYEMSPSLLKIDVQGWEEEVLKGAEKTLVTHRPVLLIETPTAGVLNFLATFDYIPMHWSGKQLNPGVGLGANTFFVSRTKS